MDPHANIKRQRELAAKIIELIDSAVPEPDDTMDDWTRHDAAIADRNETIADLANTLAEHVQALDEWRTKGGFDPYAPPDTDARAMDEIAAILSGNGWDSDTPVAISEVVRKTGREVADSGDGE